MRTSWSPARARMVSHAPSISVICLPGLFPGIDHPGIAGLARPGLEDADRRRRKVDRAGASFPVGEVNLGRVEIDMLPAQGQDFVSAAAGDGRRRCGRGTIGGGREARPAEWTPGRSGFSERGRQKAGGGVTP